MRMHDVREPARSTPNVAELVTAAVALAVGTQAYGDIISFVNPEPGDPGHFDWDLGSGANPLSWLDITQPSTDQGVSQTT